MRGKGEGRRWCRTAPCATSAATRDVCRAHPRRAGRPGRPGRLQPRPSRFRVLARVCPPSCRPRRGPQLRWTKKGDPTRCPLIGPRHLVVLSTRPRGGTERRTRPQMRGGAPTSSRASFFLTGRARWLVCTPAETLPTPRISPAISVRGPSRVAETVLYISRESLAPCHGSPPNRERGREGRTSGGRADHTSVRAVRALA